MNLRAYHSEFEQSVAPVREGTFFIGGGWAGASEGRVISNFFYKLGRVKPVLFATGGGSQFFLAWKKLV